MQRIFGKQLSPDDLLKKWRQSIKQQERQLDRQLRNIEAEEQKVKISLKQMAKQRVSPSAMRSLAMELHRSSKQKDRIHTNKAQLNSVMMQLQMQVAQLKVAGTLKKSSDVMKLMGRLSKVSEISNTMQEMQKEMMKAGIIEEMINDSMDAALEEDDLEEEADQEVDRILMEVTSGVLQTGSKAPVGQEPEVEIPEISTDIEDRLQALKN